MIKESTFEAMPQNVARLEEKVDALTETVNKLSQHILSLKASAKDEEMICVDEASKLLHLSPSRIYALVQEGRIPCYKPGRNLLFLPSASPMADRQPPLRSAFRRGTDGDNDQRYAQ